MNEAVVPPGPAYFGDQLHGLISQACLLLQISQIYIALGLPVYGVLSCKAAMREDLHSSPTLPFQGILDRSHGTGCTHKGALLLCNSASW